MFDSEQNYRTVILGRNENNDEDSIYALFPGNTIFAFQSYNLSNNKKAFAASDKKSHYFLVAEKKVEGKSTAIAVFKHPWSVRNSEIEFSHCLDCISKAQNSNCLQKIYFKVFDLYDKYREALYNSRWHTFVVNLFGIFPYKCLPAEILYRILQFVWIYTGSFPVYHAMLIPFYVLSFPFEFYLFQHNFVFSGIITKYFVSFWTLPCFFHSIFYLSYYKLQYLSHSFRDAEIKPKKIKRAVPYFIGKQYLPGGTYRQVVNTALTFLLLFFLGFIYTLPLSPFMMMGEFNE